MSGMEEDFASFGDFSSGAVDTEDGREATSDNSSKYLNWGHGGEPGSTGGGVNGDAGGFGDFSTETNVASFDFGAVDFEVPAEDVSGSDFKLSAEDLAASGLDMEWAQKIGLASEEASEDAGAAAGDLSLSLGGGDASFDASFGASFGSDNGGTREELGTGGDASEWGDFGVTPSSAAEASEFGDFTEMTASTSAGGDAFSFDDTLEEESSDALSREREEKSVAVGLSDMESSGRNEESFGSFGSLDGTSTPAGASGIDAFASFDVPSAQASGAEADAFASFGSAVTTTATDGQVEKSLDFNTTPTDTSAVTGGGNWGDFSASDVLESQEEENNASEGQLSQADDGFASFSSHASAEDGFASFSEGPTASGDAGEDFAADFGSFSGGNGAESFAGAVSGVSEGFGDFGAFDEESSLGGEGFAAFDSASVSTSAGDEAFGKFGEAKGGNDENFGSFSGVGDAQSDDWGFPEAKAAAAPATALFANAGSVNLVEMDDISFRRAVASKLKEVFGASAETIATSNAPPPPSLRTLLTSGPDGSGRCKRCQSVTFPSSHICLTCGDIIVQHSIQDQWTDDHAMKHKFAQVMYIPEAKASHHNPLQPSAPGQVLPTAIGIQEASKMAAPLSPMRGDGPPVVVATSLDPSEPSISLLPTSVPETPRAPPSSTHQQLTDFDLSVFGEIAPSKASPTTSTSSDFDSFLLGFDSASMSAKDSEMASIASINEKIEQQSRRKKQTPKRGAMEDTMEDEMDSAQPTDSKKLLEIMNRIPDLTFMSSKTLVVPASNYSFALSSNAGSR